jgi:hypothetical protein
VRLRILAPTVVDFATVPGASVREPERYAALWSERQDAVDDLLRTCRPAPTGPPPVIRLEHTRPATPVNRYRVIDDHAVDVPVHVLTGTFCPEHLPEAFSGAAERLRCGVREISVRLYDQGVLLVELLADAEQWADPQLDLPARLDDLQETAVALGAAVARECVHRYLDPVLDVVRSADRNAAIIEPARPDAYSGEVLWVTRSLVADRAAPGAEDAVRHWVKDVGAAEHEEQPPVERLVGGEIDHLARWLNYVYMDAGPRAGTMAPGQRFSDSWEAMRHAQVFYAALDVIDTRLSKILADSVLTTARWQLAGLQEQLVGLSRRAELVIMERQTLSKHLKRSVRAEMDAILDFWEHESLVEQPVLFKIGICDRRLAELAARRTARSALFTDLILLGIGVTSVLGTALALTEFGRTMASDPGLARYDLGRNAVTAWFAAQPADAILLTSGVVSLLLVVLYLFSRRHHGR